MKHIIKMLIIWGCVASVQAAPVLWNIQFQSTFPENQNAGSGFFTYDPETEDTISWFTFGGYDPISGPYGIEESIKVDTLITFDWTILGGHYNSEDTYGEGGEKIYGPYWWNDDIGNIHHPPGAISATGGRPPGFSEGKGYSESRYDGWVNGDGHYNYLSISFDNIDASSASGTWGLPFDNSYGTLTATRVGAVPIPGAIPLFSSGLLGLIWLRKKNK